LAPVNKKSLEPNQSKLEHDVKSSKNGQKNEDEKSGITYSNLLI